MVVVNMAAGVEGVLIGTFFLSLSLSSASLV